MKNGLLILFSIFLPTLSFASEGYGGVVVALNFYLLATLIAAGVLLGLISRLFLTLFELKNKPSFLKSSFLGGVVGLSIYIIGLAIFLLQGPQWY